MLSHDCCYRIPIEIDRNSDHIQFESLCTFGLISRFSLWPTGRYQGPESTHQAMATAVYPNNSQGLLLLLKDALLAARNNDRARVQSMIRDMEIPNYESWFTTTFGEGGVLG
jgi:hypothetical protein